MKLVFINVLAIASLGMVPEAIALLPDYAIAQTSRPDAIARFSSNSAPGGTQASSLVIYELPPSPGTGTPNDQRTSGGTRGGTCKKTDRSFTALVPKENRKSLTTAEHPVFWFYIPDAPNDIQAIEFSLHDQNQNETTTLYRTSLQLTKTPGVIGIPLPSSPEKSLKLNESYHWRLIVNCDPKQTSENILELDGWVTRVQQSPNVQGVIWYDELTNRAKRYLLEPQNPEVKNAWVQLLKSVGLEELAQAPLVGLVSNSKND
jgi:hypothetical protein